MAVNASNGYEYCLRCHTDPTRKQGSTHEELGKVLAVVCVATKSNILANDYQVPVDGEFQVAPSKTIASQIWRSAQSLAGS